MKAQPSRSYRSNDVVYTPDALASTLVRVLAPQGRILDPCAGHGAFTRACAGYGTVLACDITEGGAGFAGWTLPVDWIITNPPWSQFRLFLVHAMEVADHVAFLVTINHWWTQRRVAEVRQAGFGYRQLWFVDWPVTWPPNGFQLGLMHLERGYTGALSLDRLEIP